MPSQNVGAEIATNAPIIAARSASLPRLSAEMIPTPRPTTSHKIAPPIQSETVAGRRWKINSATGASLYQL